MNISSKDKMNILQVLSIMIIVLAIANVVLFAMGRIAPLLFWIVIIVCAIIAFWAVPKLNKQKENIE